MSPIVEICIQVVVMSFYLFWPNSDAISKAGFTSIAHVPSVFNVNWEYQVEASRYLRERSRGGLSMFGDKRYGYLKARCPTSQSIRAFAYALTNFLEWCEAMKLKWQKLNYQEDILGKYQAQMRSGHWSIRNKQLSANTVNARVDEACLFLSWAAGMELREPFKVSSKTFSIKIHSFRSPTGQKPRMVTSRIGRVRPDPILLKLPTDNQILTWHRSVLLKFGSTKALMCELLYKTGIRREELVQWRIDTLPFDRTEWPISGEYVTLKIKYGAKGPKYKDATGDFAGPGRNILVPLELAERLDIYRELKRPQQIARYVRAGITQQDRRARMVRPSNRLFLSDSTGQPISAASLYEAWTGAPLCPYVGWSPHLGRRYWACKWLLNGILRRNYFIKKENNNAPYYPELMKTAEEVLLMEIQPQLGHLDPKTSKLYIGWVLQQIRGPEISEAYSLSLEKLVLDESKSEK